MSRNYNAGQFEETFIPKRLQMYQIPRQPQPGVRPKRTISLNSSCFLVNDHGHLLPGIKRSKKPTFGEFIGTWDLPIKTCSTHPMTIHRLNCRKNIDRKFH